MAVLSGPVGERRKVDELQTAISAFVAQCRKPELLEPGEPGIPLTSECSLSLTPMGKWLSVEAVGESNLLSRRVVGVKSVTSSRMELVTQKLGGKTGKLLLYDAYRPANDGISRRGKRLVFGEQFRRMLQREYPGWRVAELSTEAHLEESLSPAYARALLVRGRQRVAVMASPPHSDVDGVMSFALIWLDYLRRRDGDAWVEELAVFVPAGRHRTTCLRMLYLDGARYRAFCYDEMGLACEVDLQDCGNIESGI
jgi:hypothetical protein